MRQLIEDYRRTRDLVGALYRAHCRAIDRRIAKRAAKVQQRRRDARHAVRLGLAMRSDAWHFNGIRD